MQRRDSRVSTSSKRTSDKISKLRRCRSIVRSAGGDVRNLAVKIWEGNKYVLTAPYKEVFSGVRPDRFVRIHRQLRVALSKKSDDNEIVLWDAQLASLALAPILIDTTNITNEHKVTDADVNATKYLVSLISAEPGTRFDRNEYFKKITAAKNDIGHLSLPDILRKDYKQWTEAGSVNLGISSVVKDIPIFDRQSRQQSKVLCSGEGFCSGATSFHLLNNDHVTGGWYFSEGASTLGLR